jgi:hypothetical protein
MAGMSTALKNGGTMVHPKSTSGLFLAVPRGAPTPGALAAPPTLASSATVAGGTTTTTPRATAAVAPDVPTTAVGGPTLAAPSAGPRPIPSTNSVPPRKSAGGQPLIPIFWHLFMAW